MSHPERYPDESSGTSKTTSNSITLQNEKALRSSTTTADSLMDSKETPTCQLTTKFVATPVQQSFLTVSTPSTQNQTSEDGTSNTIAAIRSADRFNQTSNDSQDWDGVPRGMLVPLCMRDNEMIELIRCPMQSPPVTIATLKELELQWIRTNINLRIDINYDHDLHFMPVCGRRGDEKRREAWRFWRSIIQELRIYQHNARKNCSACCEVDPTNADLWYFSPRMPNLFEQLRELLTVLVPLQDREQVHAHLDVDLLMQQIRMGVLDISKLSQWLADLLTRHCAPVRDRWARDMASTISQGAMEGHMDSLVEGLEKLFAFLETMRLDVANHQIRTYRGALIEESVTFQQDYFDMRIKRNKFDLASSRAWYQAAVKNHNQSCAKDPNPQSSIVALDRLIHGLAHLCLPRSGPLPLTLKYDRNRFQQIQEELQDIVFVNICFARFHQLTRKLTSRHCQPADFHRLSARVMDLTDSDDDDFDRVVSSIWQRQVEPVALEITRAAFEFAGFDKDSINEQQFQDTLRQLQHDFETEIELGVHIEKLVSILERATSEVAHRFLHMTTLAISEEQSQWQKVRQNNSLHRFMPKIEDISRRLAHMAVIHWRVWANIAYLCPEKSKIADCEDHKT